MELNKLKWTPTKTALYAFTALFIWLPFPVMLLLDLLIELYAKVSFPIYGIKKPNRNSYIQVLDRQKLQYLNWPEKINCMYCGYANGMFLYIKEIAGLTEKHFCGIMHQDRPGFKTQQHQVDMNFAAYGSQKEYKEKYSSNEN